MKRIFWIALLLACLLFVLSGCAGAAPDEARACADVQNYLTEMVDSTAVLDSCSVTQQEQDGKALMMTCDAAFSGAAGHSGGVVTLTYARGVTGWKLSACSAELDQTLSSDYIQSKKRTFEGHSYAVYFLEQIHSWQEAEDFCEQLGGHLATITSEAENEFLYSAIRKSGYCTAYFGFSDAEEEGVWKWVTGEEVDYTNWFRGEPNNAEVGEDDASFYFLDNTGCWNDSRLGLSNGGNAFICEWEHTD